MGVYAKMNLRTVVVEDEWCVQLAQNNFLWQALVSDVLTSGSCMSVFYFFSTFRPGMIISVTFKVSLHYCH